MTKYTYDELGTYTDLMLAVLEYGKGLRRQMQGAAPGSDGDCDIIRAYRTSELLARNAQALSAELKMLAYGSLTVHTETVRRHVEGNIPCQRGEGCELQHEVAMFDRVTGEQKTYWEVEA